MSAFPASRFSVGQLALRTGVRFGHIKPQWKQPRPDLAGHAPGHGEKIYFYTHIGTDEIVYSHTSVLNVYKALKQMPFAGKKNKPAKIRKDLWRQLAVVSFPSGQGVVGQSVFQRLREFRTRHLHEWGDEMFLKPNPAKPSLKLSRSRKERGAAIIAQKPNSIADLAAVLAGAGAGSRMWIQDESGSKVLCPATVQWANAGDHQYAQSWTDNVTHIEMDQEQRKEPVEVEERAEDDAQESSPVAPAEELSEPKKKGLFSWGS
ncbi:hypothetical protein CFIMG_000584RA [Ceratocystis fimbriata CBS 114723]|uniref:Large ribosomal subunit protein mL67 n=1 Tax=Ceratocystis fimbriata CBS 114723 TaxID=1035309 RepID=A0A2C5XGN9_9PEZI|nr:hypothetical protein CFIMG_000584RA [Ceratocystis fimbriata CBS 114723]